MIIKVMFRLLSLVFSKFVHSRGVEMTTEMAIQPLKNTINRGGQDYYNEKWSNINNDIYIAKYKPGIFTVP